MPEFVSSTSLPLNVYLFDALSLLSLKLNCFKRCVGLTSPEAIASKS